MVRMIVVTKFLICSKILRLASYNVKGIGQNTIFMGLLKFESITIRKIIELDVTAYFLGISTSSRESLVYREI